jgi:hypothetical protein
MRPSSSGADAGRYSDALQVLLAISEVLENLTLCLFLPSHFKLGSHEAARKKKENRHVT